MSLRKAQRGYRYQDFMSARIALSEMIKQGNPILRIDEKETKDDIVDDIKIIRNDRKLCYQIKYTTTEKALSWIDIANKGQLDFAELLKHFLQEQSAVEYIFILKWRPPSTNDELYQYLCRENTNCLIIEGTTTYKINAEKYSDLNEKLNLISDGVKLNSFLDSIHFICNAPDASLDITNPKSLENQLISFSTQLGIGIFPNNKQTPNNFVIKLVDELTFKRSAEIFEISINDLLQKLGVATNFGAIPQIFQLNNEIFVSQPTKIDDLYLNFSDTQKLILLGEPGSGKSYLTNEFIKKLQSEKIKYCHHYFFVGNNDSLAVDRINKDVLIGNLLNEVYICFPMLKDSCEIKFGATIEILNNAISQIKEPFFVIIDGIDHAYREYYRTTIQKDIVELISAIIPTDYVKIMFVSQPIAQLKTIADAKEIEMQSWNKQQIKEFLPKFGLILNESEIDKVVNLSKGNPLYLTYLLNTIKQYDNSVLDVLPQYNDNITVYYSYLIEKINDNELFELISTIPFLFERDEIVEISNRGNFALSKFDELLPILQYDRLRGGYRVYHESLKRYIYDFCKDQGIDLSQTKGKILSWLKKKVFYANPKSYRHTFALAYELEEYEFVASYIGYDFLNKSVYYGNSQDSIARNLDFIKQSICKVQDYYKLSTYMLVDRIMQQHQEEDFLTSNESEFFQAYMSLFGQAGVNDLIYRRKMDGKTLNALLYNANLMGFSIPWELADNKVKYTEYEEDTFARLFLRKKLIDGADLIKIENELPYTDARYLLEEAVLTGNSTTVFNAIEKGWKNCNNVKLLANALCLEKKFVMDITFDFDEQFSESDRGNLYKRIIDFISFCDINLQNEEVQKKLESKAPDGFIWAFFKYVFEVKNIYRQCKTAEELIACAPKFVHILQDFVMVSQPFNGSPRACDLTDSTFRAILLEQLFFPMHSIIDVLFQRSYMTEIIALYNKVGTSFRGSKTGCILFFEIMNKAASIITKENYGIIIDLFNNQINEEKAYSLYDYIASYYFKISFLISPYNKRQAKEYYVEGIKYTLTYGYHREIFLYEVLGSFEFVKEQLDDKIKIYAELGNMAFAMNTHTDGKDTRHLPNKWFDNLTNADINGALEFLSSWQIEKQYNWQANKMCSSILKKIKVLVPDELYFYALITNQFENYDYNYLNYIKFIKELYAKGKLTIANNLFAYLCGLPAGEICKDNNLVLSIKEIAKDHKILIPNFIYESTEPVSHYEEEKIKLKECSVADFEKGDNIIRTSTPVSVIKTLVSLDFDTLTKKKIIELFKNELRYEHNLFSEYLYEIEQIEMRNEKRVFLYMCIYVILTDGWFDSFYYSDYAKKAFDIDRDYANNCFFEIVLEVPDCLHRGIDNLIRTLSLIDFDRDIILRIWENVISFARLRILDTPDTVKERDLYSDKCIEVQVSKMLLTKLSDYTSDNHKRILRFIYEYVIGNSMLEKPLLQYIFANWGKYNYTTRFEIMALFSYSNFNFSNYIEECQKAIENDENLLTKILLAASIKDKQEIKIHPESISEYIESESITEDEMLYCEGNVFNFYIVRQFCDCFNIDSRKIISKYKQLRKMENKSGTWSSFCSPITKRILDNYISYDLYLQAINTVLQEAFLQGLINASDIVSLGVEIIPELYSIIVSSESAMLEDDNIVLARYTSDEEEKANEQTKTQKHIKFDIACVKDQNKNEHNLVINNMKELTAILIYNPQIVFMLDPILQILLGLESEIENGYLCAKDNKGNIVLKYLTTKSKMRGVDYFNDRYYTHEEGKLIMTKNYLPRLREILGDDFFMASHEETI